METLITWFQNNWQPIVKLILVLIVGFIVIKIITAILNRIFKRTKMEKAAHGFLITVVKIALYVVYLIVILSILGIPTTSFVAILTSFSLALSLALQDTLSNFASGILLITNKPFVSGDRIDVDGTSGVVQEITISSTKILTADNKVVTLPNSTVAKANITNYSTMEDRRVDMEFGVAYGSDIDKVKGVIMSVVEKHPLIDQDKGITIRLSSHGEHALIFVARVWTKNENYWDVFFDLNEQMPKAFDEANIVVPFNQLEVTVKRED